MIAPKYAVSHDRSVQYRRPGFVWHLFSPRRQICMAPLPALSSGSLRPLPDSYGTSSAPPIRMAPLLAGLHLFRIRMAPLLAPLLIRMAPLLHCTDSYGTSSRNRQPLPGPGGPDILTISPSSCPCPRSGRAPRLPKSLSCSARPPWVASSSNP